MPITAKNLQKCQELTLSKLEKKNSWILNARYKIYQSMFCIYFQTEIAKQIQLFWDLKIGLKRKISELNMTIITLWN